MAQCTLLGYLKMERKQNYYSSRLPSLPLFKGPRSSSKFPKGLAVHRNSPQILEFAVTMGCTRHGVYLVADGQ
jgi:hypothetical protein